MRPLLIVRPEPGASATAKAAEAMGLVAVVAPLFEIRPLDWRAPPADDFDALLLTSANAVRTAAAKLRDLANLPAYCVGEATAAVAADAGLQVRGTGESGIDALLRSLAPGLKLLHVCGADRRDAANASQAIEHVPVYESVELPVRDRLDAIGNAVVALHSPRAAKVLAGQVDRHRFAVAAISEATAEAAGEGWERVEVADRPTDSDLLAIAARLCNNPG